MVAVKVNYAAVIGRVEQTTEANIMIDESAIFVPRVECTSGCEPDTSASRLRLKPRVEPGNDAGTIAAG